MAKLPGKGGKKIAGIEALKHADARRRNIPTAELESVMRDEDKSPVQVAYGRRNRDLDPQLVWRGKDEQDWSDLIVQAPPLYIQEKVHPKVLIDDLRRESEGRAKAQAEPSLDLFGDFNGLHDPKAKTEFYRHDQNWTNRLILGDSLSVMASLAEREGLRGQVQCIYFDPPYGIKFNSNFQWSTTTRDVKDGAKDHITREPEQVKAFRDTWRDGVHSYLTYLRDRLTVARDLLADTGSVFVQIGDENSHRVRALLDEVFGEDNFCSTIQVTKTGSQSGDLLSNIADSVIWYARDKSKVKFRKFYLDRPERDATEASPDPVLSSGFRTNTSVPFLFRGRTFDPGTNYNWKTHLQGMERLARAERLIPLKSTLRYARYFSDFPVKEASNIWNDLGGANNLIYVVQTSTRLIERCLLMTSDPGDLVLDPTCGSGTTAYVAEQWGRRWITMDTSRVALALARSRIMGARYPYYLLADTPQGQMKEAEIAGTVPRSAPTHGNVKLGFVYERVPHITLKSIANNAEIDVIWEKWQAVQEPLRAALNTALGKAWQEWEIPREAEGKWPAAAKEAHARWWEARIARQKEIDASIAAKADYEYLYDRPHADSSRVRVAGPFTVESLSPHRALAVDADDSLIDGMKEGAGKYRHDGSGGHEDFAAMILENLRAAGVQQAAKADRITFTSLTGWPGRMVCAEGRFMEGERERRAGILIGPEFGTVARPDLVAAAREAADAGFDVLIACAFNYDAQSADFDSLGKVPVLKARMNPDLHMGDDLKATGSGNLFVVFGEPDIDILPAEPGADGGRRIQVKINGIDVFKPQSGEIESGGPESIALWMIDTDYNEESFFVRHAYFLGANDPYRALKTTLKAEIDEEAWESLHSDTSRPFARPASGRIAVKVINHLGDEVMKVFNVN